MPEKKIFLYFGHAFFNIFQVEKKNLYPKFFFPKNRVKTIEMCIQILCPKQTYLLDSGKRQKKTIEQIIDTPAKEIPH
jgi:hypothetical protein